MERRIRIAKDYLYIPICVSGEEKKLEIFLEKDGNVQEKIYELMIPVDEGAAREKEYSCDYFAEIPVERYRDEQFLIGVDAPDAFGNRIYNGEKQEAVCGSRPLIHFTADTGWTNDPNGLIYKDGVYHLYFQYNPFHVSWNNMSWGHAVSRDLLHWKQQDSVMFPDESGTIFSGCAIANDKGMLRLPKEAIVFFYTAAGGSSEWSRGLEFTQKIAYSLDGGRTLTKIKEPCVPVVCRENRDPKVYWHEESGAYIMVLWMEGNDFAIFRSEDLEHWEKSHQFTLEDAWECPDLMYLTSEEGDSCWFFWSADGFYYPGEFDGYQFRSDGVKRYAYMNKIPYAAQTYSGVEDRVISIPWLRLQNDGRLFTGSYGIPTELSCKKTKEGFVLIQKPVRELMEQAVKLDKAFVTDENGRILYEAGEGRKALAVHMLTENENGDCGEQYLWEVNGSRISYESDSGRFIVDEEEYQAGAGHREFLFIVDDRILEVFFDGGIRLGTFILKETRIRFETSGERLAEYAVYEIK